MGLTFPKFFPYELYGISRLCTVYSQCIFMYVSVCMHVCIGFYEFTGTIGLEIFTVENFRGLAM